MAAYVWDFASRRGTSQHLSFAIAELEGADTASALNADSTTQENLKGLFESAGLTDVITRPIEISVTFRDFDDYWASNTGFASPVSTVLKSLTESQQQQTKQLVKAQLPIDDHGVISYSATVNAGRSCA